MEKAAKNPKILTISDWSNFKSWEYIAAQNASALSILYALQCFARIVTELLLIPTSCVDSILINGKGKIDCPGEGFLVNHTTSFMKYALYPSHVNDKG